MVCGAGACGHCELGVRGAGTPSDWPAVRLRATTGQLDFQHTVWQVKPTSQLNDPTAPQHPYLASQTTCQLDFLA